MASKRIVVIGTSAGGIEALRTLLGGLPREFPSPLCVVMHTAPYAPGTLHEILGRATSLTVVNPRSGDRLRNGHVYVAPPDCHLLIEPGKVRVTKGPKENSFRPAIDPLFRSAAQVYGPGTIGVVLTGGLDDGTAGLWAIKRLGGIAIVQDPDEALYSGMPLNAINNVRVDYVVRLSEIAPLLVKLTSVLGEVAAPLAVPEDVEIEVNIAKEQDPMDAGLERIAKPSVFACPECQGVLMELKDNGHARFRCHTGHAYSMESLLAAINTSAEESLWSAVRIMHEGELLLQKLADHFEAGHDQAEAMRLKDRAREMRRRADVMQRLVTDNEPMASKK